MSTTSGRGLGERPGAPLQADPSRPAGRCRILMVDAPGGSLDALAAMFASAGLGVERLSALASAGAACEAGTFDLAIVRFSDLRRTDAPVWNTTLAATVVVIERGDVGAALEALRLGAVDCLEEPWAEHSIGEVVTRHVRAARLRRSEARCGPLASPMRADGHLSVLLRHATTGALRPNEFVQVVGRLRSRLAELNLIDARLRVTAAMLPGTIGQATDRRVVAFLADLEAKAPRSLHWSEADWADLLAIDAGHLGRLIRQQTRLSFRQWRRLWRIKHAARLIALDDEQISQVAFAVGFKDVSQFRREFLEVVGLTPRGLRSLLRRLDVTRNDS